MKRLTAKFVDGITRPGKFHDGDAGLYLYVQQHKGRIRKSYVQRVTVNGKRVEIGLGSAKWTTPSEARAMAQANRKIARTGGDPRCRPKTAPRFEDAADTVIRIHATTWKDGGKSEARWRATLATYAFPRLGRRSVAEITTADVLSVLVPHWSTKRETMRRVRQRIGTVMKWAIAEGHRNDNPAGDALGEALPKGGHHKRHHRALPHEHVSEALCRVRASAAYPTTVLAFEFLVLTAARSGEVRGARWEEANFEAAVWTVPDERMKTGRAHRVPLSGRALAVLRTATEFRDHTGLMFPSLRGLTLSDMTLSKLVKELGIDAVPHGFRSSFRMWAAERTQFPREVAEFALAHVVGDEAERAYQRSDLFELRRELMEAWARYLNIEDTAVLAAQ